MSNPLRIYCVQYLARVHATQAHELQQLRDGQHQLRDRPPAVATTRGPTRTTAAQLGTVSHDAERAPLTPERPLCGG